MAGSQPPLPLLRHRPSRWVACPVSPWGPTRVVLLVVLAVLGAAPSRVHGDDRIVTLWHAYGGAEADGLNEAVRQFRRLHPDLRVEVVHTAFGAYGSKLEAAIPTGHGPDVFIDAHERLATYRERGLVAAYGPLPLPLRLEFEAQHLAALSSGDQIYGLPLSAKCAALYLNEDLFDGVPETLEEIAALRGTLPAETYPLVFEAESSYYDAAFLHAFGAELIDAEGGFAFRGEAAEDAIGFIADLVATGVVPEEANGDLVKQLFSSGRAAAAISGPWLAPDLPDSLRWRVVPLPRLAAAGGRAMRPYVTIEGAFFAANAREEEGARALMAFLAGPDGARIRALRGRQVVAARSVWEERELAADAFLATFRRASASGTPMSSHPHMKAIFEPATRAIRKVLRGDVPTAVALAEAERRFADATRPLPEERNPAGAMIAIGLILFLLTLTIWRRARDRVFRGEVRASLPAYRYVAHAAVAVLALVIAPLLVGVLTSFFAGRGTDMHYVGVANYVDILTARGGALLDSGSFWMVLVVTVLWTALNLVSHLVLGVLLALVLHRPAMKLKGVYRVLLILPWAVPNYVTALSWKGMFHRQFGAINAILAGFGVEPISFFGSFSTAFAANLITNIWLGFPFMMVVTLGALSAIPRDLYEAAEVDGAGPWQRFWLITWPMLRPMLAPSIAMGAVWTFNMFNVVFLVSGGEPDGATEILVSEAYRWAFTRSSQYGYAAAYAVLIFLILFFGTRLRFRRTDGMGATT